MKKLILIAFATCLFAAISNAQNKPIQGGQPSSNLKKMDTKKTEAQSFNEYQEVVKALQPYIESARTGDGKLSRSAFYEHAHIVGSVDGEFSLPNADQFGEAVSSGGPSENVQYHIAWIDISGPAAAAKVEFIDWGGFRFTDFFVLYKKEGEWKISGKVYDSHSRN